MNTMNFDKKERNNSTLQTLAQALANRDKSVINTGNIVAPQGGSSQNNENILGGVSELLTGGKGLFKGLQSSGLLSGSNNNSELSAVGNGINDYVKGSSNSFGTIGDAANSYVNGGGNSLGLIGDAANSSILSGGGLLSFIPSALNGLNKGFNHSDDKEIMGGIGNGIQGFFNVNENDSDVMQGINGTVDGALKGTMIMPGIGTIVGGLLGLGSSFLDDL